MGGLAARTTLAVAGAGSSYWLLWWIWVLAPTIGRVVAGVAWAAVSVTLGWRGGGPSGRPVMQVIGIATVTAIAAVGLLTLHGGMAVAPRVASGSTYVTADNLFPQQWYERVEERGDLREPALNWPLNERPPAQAGWIAPAMTVSANQAFAYQILSATLQALAASAAAVLFVVMGLKAWRHVAATALVTVTVFMFANTVFVWPKLLPAALLALAVAVVVEGRRSVTTLAWAAVAAAVALGLMAHPGGTFAAPTLLVAMIMSRSWPATRTAILCSGAVGAVVLLPWAIYLLFYDPSSSILLKWHLGGVSTADERPFTQLVVDQYRDLGVAGAFRNRWSNLKMLFGFGVGLSTGWDPGVIRSWWQLSGFFAPLWSGGLLILTAPLLFLRRRYPREIFVVAVATLVGFLLWIAVMFGPPVGTAVTYHGPYGLFLLLGVVLAAVAATVLPRWILAALVAIQITATLWVVYPLGALDSCYETGMCTPADYPPDTTSPGSLYVWIALAALASIGTGAVLAHRLSTSESHQPSLARSTS